MLSKGSDKWWDHSEFASGRFLYVLELWEWKKKRKETKSNQMT